MTGTEVEKTNVSLSTYRIKRHHRCAKKILDGFFAFAVLRVKQFLDQEAITKERYLELIRFFSDNKDRILSLKLETWGDVVTLNEHLDAYAHVSASFIPDAEMWSRLLQEKR